MYFIMGCQRLTTEDGEALLEIHNDIEVGNVWYWRDGKPLEPDEENVPTPIVIDFDPFRGYQGPPEELFDVGVPLMSARLAEAITEAGVTNVRFFKTTLRNTVSGKTYAYQTFKVVGLVAAADLAKSTWSSYDGHLFADVSFEGLTLDKTKIPDLLMFRLAENLNGLLVHKKVRDHILAKGIDTLKFIKPKDWVHV